MQPRVEPTLYHLTLQNGLQPSFKDQGTTRQTNRQCNRSHCKANRNRTRRHHRARVQLLRRPTSRHQTYHTRCTSHNLRCNKDPPLRIIKYLTMRGTRRADIRRKRQRTNRGLTSRSNHMTLRRRRQRLTSGRRRGHIHGRRANKSSISRLIN